MREWLDSVYNPVVIEIGAGRAVPTIRLFGKSLCAPLIRINPDDVDVERREDVALKMGGLEGISAIAAGY